jgi:hypothetical protein
LARPARGRTGTAAGTRGSGRGQSRPNPKWPRSSRRLPRRMHGPTLTGTQRGARPRSGTRRRRPALENRLPGNWPAGSGTHPADRNSRLHAGSGGCGGSFVHGPRSGLGNDHARCGRRRGNRARRRLSHRRSARRNRRRRCRNRSMSRRQRRWWTRRSANRGRGRRHRRYHSRPVCGRRDDWPHWRLSHRLRRNRSRWRRGHRLRRGRCDHRLFYCRGYDWPRRGWSDGFLALGDRSQHIAGTGNVGKIDLGFDFFFAAGRARTGLACRRRTFRRGTNVGAYLLRFLLFQRTGVRLFLCDSDQRESIENGFALDFQLSGKIVDSYFTHPAFRFSAL